MVNNYWILGLLCSTGWFFVILGVLLKFPAIFQIIIIIIGLILSTVSIIGLIKHLLSGNK